MTYGDSNKYHWHRMSSNERDVDEICPSGSLSSKKSRNTNVSHVGLQHDHLKSDDDDVHVLRPLPLYIHKQRNNNKECYVTWKKEEIEYSQYAYRVIKSQLPEECQRMISSKVLEHIRKTPSARELFHPAHLESSAKFRHVIRRYCE